MKATEAIQHMTKIYLHRIIDSFARDFPKHGEDKSRDIINKNVSELTDKSRIKRVLQLNGPWSEQILLSYILEALVNHSDYAATEEEIITEVADIEKQIIKEAKDPESLKYENSRNLEIIKEVLIVALEDKQVGIEELNLIIRLREKLNISERAMKIIMAQLNHFPQSGNNVHTPSDFKEALINLQRRGILFYCNKLDSVQYVIPEEIVETVKETLGIELSKVAYKMMLNELKGTQLASILDANGIPKSGNKEERIERILIAGIQPSTGLDTLSNEDLYNLCSSLPGAKVGGRKQDRVQRIIDYFSNLVIREVSTEAPPGERYYNYLVELAARDRENLLANKVIKKDIDMERAFEEGTKYLFSQKLGLQLEELSGTDHCDGCIRFNKSGDILMWDNKSKESKYRFPPSHLRQFKRYIRDSSERVSCFLIIVPEVDDKAAFNASRLKVESGSDTDVAIISAEDLLWLADSWANNEKSKQFDLNVFNMTGILNRQALEDRLKLFA